MAYNFGNWVSSNPLTGQIADWIAPDQAAKARKEAQDEIVNPQNQGYKKSSQQYDEYINNNTGQQGYNASRDAGINDGTQMYQSAFNNAKNETAGLADNLTAKQSAGAASLARGAARSSGMTKAQAADMGANQAANNYANNYTNNYNTQLGQQNNLMNTNLGQMNAQQNAYNQNLMNQLNAQGTKMGADLTNDQAVYQQNIKNQETADKRNANNKKSLFGFVGDLFSDENLKTNKAKVGIGGDEDLRLVHYRNTCEKLKHMNPNKWEELKWQGGR